MSVAHPASPAAACRPPPVSDGQIKLVMVLKPETLPHDASAGDLRIWLKKFEAYNITSECRMHIRQLSMHVS